MNLSKLIDKLMRVMQENGPEILTAMGVVGVGTTAYLAAKGASQATEMLRVERAGLRSAGEPDELTPVQTLKYAWPYYVPALVSGAGTITCIVMASKGNHKRTAAAVTAYSLTEKAFSDYRDRMVEELGRNKDQKVLDAVAHKQVMEKPPPAEVANLIVIGRDKVLCCELYTMRYFDSNVETLNRAVNETNRWIISNRKATLSDFYNEIGLPPTDASPHLGWTDEELLDLVFSYGGTEDGRPYLAFRYNYGPNPLV